MNRLTGEDAATEMERKLTAHEKTVPEFFNYLERKDPGTGQLVYQRDKVPVNRIKTFIGSGKHLTDEELFDDRKTMATNLGKADFAASVGMKQPRERKDFNSDTDWLEYVDAWLYRQRLGNETKMPEVESFNPRGLAWRRLRLKKDRAPQPKQETKQAQEPKFIDDKGNKYFTEDEIPAKTRYKAL